MPTVLRVEGFRFFFYPFDCVEPIHVHVSRGNSLAKVWVERLAIAKSFGYRSHEETRILQLVGANKDYLIARWRQVCGGLND